MYVNSVKTLLFVCIWVKLFNEKRHETVYGHDMQTDSQVVFESSVLPFDAVVGRNTHMEQIRPERSRPTLHAITLCMM